MDMGSQGRIFAVFAGIALCASAAAAQERRDIVIGTGGVTGVYFPAGGSICRLVNARRPIDRIRCALTSTEGSVSNLRALAAGDIDFAIVQADWQFHAARGSSSFADDGPMESLRAVFSLHPEYYTVVARTGSGIERFEDLRGRRINAGADGSGQRAVTEGLMRDLGWSDRDLAALTAIPVADQPAALCAGRIDAMVYMVGHPSSAILEATSDCDSRIVAVDNAAVTALVESNPLYAKGTIPGGMYRNTDDDRATFSIDATLVTTEAMPDDVVYRVTRAVLTGLPAFRSMHAAFAGLDPERMARQSLTAPLHAGARHYFEEAGLLE